MVVPKSLPAHSLTDVCLMPITSYSYISLNPTNRDGSGTTLLGNGRDGFDSQSNTSRFFPFSSSQFRSPHGVLFNVYIYIYIWFCEGVTLTTRSKRRSSHFETFCSCETETLTTVTKERLTIPEMS
jgi:hypothetical protein